MDKFTFPNIHIYKNLNCVGNYLPTSQLIDVCVGCANYIRLRVSCCRDQLKTVHFGHGTTLLPLF